MRPSRTVAWMIRLALLAIILMPGSHLSAQEGPAVVKAVMFWMNGCPHCHQVIETVLPPLQQRYGSQLEIQLVEIETAQEVEQLYAIAVQLGLSKEETRVPLLLIGEHVLSGSVQIPAELPGLIEEYLKSGGVDLPALSGLADLAAVQASCPPESACVASTQPDPPASNTGQASPKAGEPVGPIPTTANELASTATTAIPQGGGLAIVIMAGMVVAIVYSGLTFGRPVQQPHQNWTWVIPTLTLIGLGVSAYLAYVETQAVAAACGPVGDCNAVQTSSYAYLFGIPIGVLGVAGYLAILGVWAWGQWGSGRYVVYAPAVLYVLTLVGALFSLYLTYLEPFVIRAVCAWCLTSAVIVTLLMLVAQKIHRMRSLRGGWV